MVSKKNLMTIPQFMIAKPASRWAINHAIERGYIVPELTEPVILIDFAKYKNVDIYGQLKEDNKLAKLEEDVKSLKKDVASMKKVVFNGVAS